MFETVLPVLVDAVKHLRLEALRAQQSYEVALRRHAEASRILDDVRNYVLTRRPLPRLPNDVLELILEHSMSRVAKRSRIGALSKLTSVCREWRQLLLNCGRLWTTIYVDFDRLPGNEERNDCRQLVSLAMSRANAAPLDVHVHHIPVGFACDSLSPFLLSTALPRAKSANLSFSTTEDGDMGFDLSVLLYLLQSLPLLESVAINFDGYPLSSHPLPLSVSLFPRASGLRHLQVEGNIMFSVLNLRRELPDCRSWEDTITDLQLSNIILPHRDLHDFYIPRGLTSLGLIGCTLTDAQWPDNSAAFLPLLPQLHRLHIIESHTLLQRVDLDCMPLLEEVRVDGCYLTTDALYARLRACPGNVVKRIIFQNGWAQHLCVAAASHIREVYMIDCENAPYSLTKLMDCRVIQRITTLGIIQKDYPQVATWKLLESLESHLDETKRPLQATLVVSDDLPSLLREHLRALATTLLVSDYDEIVSNLLST
ncbi:hypothetical protein EXIGLDRAFT_775826 [Exidia glandulosa HHB12029]|uniref:F-box domain-containing protein n=1 Tax=Exidia glandulosa HHB12029 TaxID=1314781 RepID=A0A165ZRC8_EXIGL|nr:hypothetical protein EXIGLDRAFT_775826 [Exidia glandulosa HHB12029]